MLSILYVICLILLCACNIELIQVEVFLRETLVYLMIYKNIFEMYYYIKKYT
jgi:hypothetical protein